MHDIYSRVQMNFFQFILYKGHWRVPMTFFNSLSINRMIVWLTWDFH